MQLKDAFNKIREEAKKANLTEDRIKLLDYIEIEAKLGCPFADKLKRLYPEIITDKR